MHRAKFGPLDLKDSAWLDSTSHVLDSLNWLNSLLFLWSHFCKQPHLTVRFLLRSLFNALFECIFLQQHVTEFNLKKEWTFVEFPRSSLNSCLIYEAAGTYFRTFPDCAICIMVPIWWTTCRDCCNQTRSWTVEVIDFGLQTRGDIWNSRWKGSTHSARHLEINSPTLAVFLINNWLERVNEWEALLTNLDTCFFLILGRHGIIR